MGKGDKKTKRGKITMGTYGVRRRRKKTKAYVAPAPKKKAAPAKTKAEPKSKTETKAKSPAKTKAAAKPKKEATNKEDKK